MIKKQNLSQHYQTIIIDFLKTMLKDNPEQRFTAEQALNHSIFKLK
jgi:serine/threonine protein kinase